LRDRPTPHAGERDRANLRRAKGMSAILTAANGMSVLVLAII
jgi:hypothetical protein